MCTYPHALPKRKHDHNVPVHRDGGQRQRRNVHAHRLRAGHHVAHGRPEHPAPDERVQRRERHGQQAHQDVGHGQIGDEEIGDGVHGPIAAHHEADEQVAGDADAEDGRVHQAEHALHGQQIDEAAAHRRGAGERAAGSAAIGAAVAVRVGDAGAICGAVGGEGGRGAGGVQQQRQQQHIGGVLVVIGGICQRTQAAGELCAELHRCGVGSSV